MTRMGNEMIKELSAIMGTITKTASQNDGSVNDTLELIKKMAETAAALDEAGNTEAASAVDDALRVIMKDLQKKTADYSKYDEIEDMPLKVRFHYLKRRLKEAKNEPQDIEQLEWVREQVSGLASSLEFSETDREENPGLYENVMELNDTVESAIQKLEESSGHAGRQTKYDEASRKEHRETYQPTHSLSEGEDPFDFGGGYDVDAARKSNITKEADDWDRAHKDMIFKNQEAISRHERKIYELQLAVNDLKSQSGVG